MQQTNLKSVFVLCRAVLRPMMKARAGRIVNVTSVVAFSGNAGQTNYAAAKAGMVGFSKSLAREVGSRNITVNCVAPGFVETDMTRALAPEQVKKLWKTCPWAAWDASRTSHRRCCSLSPGAGLRHRRHPARERRHAHGMNGPRNAGSKKEARGERPAQRGIKGDTW